MAARKNAAPVVPDYRGHLRYRLDGIKAILTRRDGSLDPLFIRAYGLDRLDALASGDPVTVRGYEIAELFQRGVVNDYELYDI